MINDFSCKRFDELLPDYLEETLDARARIAMDAHAASCVRCTAILRDIAGIRAEASRLPALRPSRDLWQGIATRIEPRVVPLAERRAYGLSHRWIAIAAAALIASTASVTYLLTSRTMQSRPAAVATTKAAEEPTGPRDSTPAIAPVPSGETTVAAATPAPPESTSPKVTEPRAVAVSTKPARAPSAVLTSRALTATELAYGDEISRLQTVIATRRKDLDPATVTVIEENLKVIDAALKKSRDALSRDPASGLLTDQLKTVLDKKVELLRTVALLPSRT
jgi:hypothetical protein